MSSRGNCYDNAMVETVSKTIKSELIWRVPFASGRLTITAIGQYIEASYYLRRRHSSPGYVTPAAFEASFRANAQKEIVAFQ